MDPEEIIDEEIRLAVAELSCWAAYASSDNSNIEGPVKRINARIEVLKEQCRNVVSKEKYTEDIEALSAIIEDLGGEVPCL